MKNNLLETGDVIILDNGMNVYYNEDRPVVTIGEVFGNEDDVRKAKNGLKGLTHLLVKTAESKGVFLDYESLYDYVLKNYTVTPVWSYILYSGEYLVIKTALDGGSTGHDEYPDGHHVWCQRLIDGKFNESGEVVHFYQSGSFQIVHNNIMPVRKMNMSVTWE